MKTRSRRASFESLDKNAPAKAGTKHALSDIDHRLTKLKHPWTNGPVERMNRTIKEATVKRYFYETHDELRNHPRDFVDAYNFARRPKTLRGLTPYGFVCKAWTSHPQRFTISRSRKCRD